MLEQEMTKQTKKICKILGISYSGYLWKGLTVCKETYSPLVSQVELDEGTMIETMDMKNAL